MTKSTTDKYIDRYREHCSVTIYIHHMRTKGRGTRDNRVYTCVTQRTMLHRVVWTIRIITHILTIKNCNKPAGSGVFM